MGNSFIRKYLGNKKAWIYLASGGFVLGAVLLGIMVSTVRVSVPVVFRVITDHLFGFGLWNDIPKNIDMIIWEIRFPRVLLAFCVGAALSLAGAAFQGLLRNPLADPYTIGVSSGAAVGAVSVLYFNLSFIGGYTLPVMSIFGGFLTLLLVFGVTRLSNRDLSVETIILAGIIISSFLGSIISLVIALSAQSEMNQIIYWLMGSVGMRGWSHVTLLIPFLLIGSVLILFRHRELNALALGETSAQHIGVHVNRSKTSILLGASLLTGASVAVSGAIGFVGLVIPHFVRLLVGPGHQHVLPLSMLIGGGYLVLADLVARTVISPSELPIGVVTALIGAPVFALLLIRERTGKGMIK